LDSTTFINNNSDDEQPITQETQGKFLANSEYIRSIGLKDLTQYIGKMVSEEMKLWPLSKACNLDDVTTIVTNIRTKVEGTGLPINPIFYGCLLPAEGEGIKPLDKQLDCLVNETRDILESTHFGNLLQTCFHKSFVLLHADIKEAFTIALGTQNHDNLSTLPIPKIIPIVKKEFDCIMNTLPQQISSMKEIEEYSYRIFTSSCDDLYPK